MNNRTYPVRIRGVDYPSQKAAAEALGVSPMTVSAALALGRPDRIGVGSKRIAVTINGKTFPTMRAAAAALGLSYMAVRWRTRSVGANQ